MTLSSSDKEIVRLRSHREATAPLISQPGVCGYTKASVAQDQTGPWHEVTVPQVPPQLLNNPTHVIQHLAFGSIVLLSNGISHGICPHKHRVPVVRAGKRMESQVQSHPVHFSTGASQ